MPALRSVLRPSCRAAPCLVCRGEADTPTEALRQVLLRCPVLMQNRHRLLGNIYPSEEDVRSAQIGAVVIATCKPPRASRPWGRRDKQQALGR